MNKRIKALWVAALRSGDYKQCRNQMRNGQKFDPFGVLCNLHALEHPKFAAMQKMTNFYDGCISSPPVVVYAWAQLPSSEASHLVWLNDKQHLNFAALADYIEFSL